MDLVNGESPSGMVAYVLDCNFSVSEFEIQWVGGVLVV